MLPWVLRLHGFRAPADGCLPWQLQSLFPARLRGSAPCPSSSRRPARRRGGCRSGPTGPAATAACAWREVPDWPGFVARALRGLRLGREWLEQLQLGARMLKLPVKVACGCWMCQEGSPLARLLKRWLLKQQLVLVLDQLLRPQELQSSLELVPVLKLLRWSRRLVQPANRAAAPPATGEVARFDAAVVQRLAAGPATAAVVTGQWIWRGLAVDRGTVERHP